MRPRGRGNARTGAVERSVEPVARVDTAALRRSLTQVIEPVAGRSGFDLEKVRVTRLGRRHRVQVVVDRDEGVSLDAIADISRELSVALDAAEATGDLVIPGEYVLEVSSPGVDRPLTEPRHWRRNLGRLVTVQVPEEGTVTGRITEVTEVAVTLDLDGTIRQWRYEQLGPGRVQVELRPMTDAGEDAGGDDGEG
jgi:ribosome maturation factor RimP